MRLLYIQKNSKLLAKLSYTSKGFLSVLLLMQFVGGCVSSYTKHNETFSAAYAKGESFYSDNLITYSVPNEYPQEGEPLFNIEINGKYTGVYSDFNAWKNWVSFGYFDFNPEKEVEIVITVAQPFKEYKLLPESNGIVSTRKGNTICFKLKQAGQFISLVLDDQYKGNTLHLFANPIDFHAPTASNDSLLYFGPGYHDLEKIYGIESLVLKDKNLYIAGGAVVNGTIRIDRSDGITVSGHGVLMKRKPNNLVLTANRSNNINIEGIIICSQRNPGWTVGFSESSDIRVSHAKVVSTRYASTDGFDFINSGNIHLSNVFIRACDDAIAIKGLFRGNPEDGLPNENMLFEHLQLWNDCNSTICLGAETRAKYYKNIHFRDIDVLFSYDDRDHHGKLDERSVMTICSLDATFFSNITFENIRVNRCERLICLTFKDNFWFGSIKGNQSVEGGIDHVTFRNISVASCGESLLANEILLNGWSKDGTPVKIINNITFNNVLREGILLTSENDAKFKTNNTQEETLVKNLIFIPGSSTNPLQ